MADRNEQGVITGDKRTREGADVLNASERKEGEEKTRKKGAEVSIHRALPK